MTSAPSEKPILNSKQQQDYDKHCFELNKHNTTIYNEMFDELLKSAGLDQPGESCSTRTDSLYWMIRKLSREKMSVYMIQKLLEVIFSHEDITQDQDEAKTHEILKDKFKFCADLAQSAKLSISELLTHASKKVCAKLAILVSKSTDTLCLIDYFITIKFFKESILPRAWFPILKDQLLKKKDLDRLLTTSWQNEKLIRDSELKKGLFVCIA